MIFLETDRLLLRKFQDTDFEDFCAFAIDPEMCRMMGRDNITDPDSARFTFHWLKDKEPRGYALVLKETNRVIGNLTVANVSSDLAKEPVLSGKKGCSLSFSLSRHYQRRGLMEEAVRAVIDKLFREEHMDYINYGHFDFNIPSANLQKKLGFEHLRTDIIDIDGIETVCVENILWNSPIPTK